MPERGKAKSRMLGAVALGALWQLPITPPARAQSPSAPSLQVPVLTRDCARSAGADEILVCGQRGEEPRSRYRVPEAPDRGFDPAGAADSVSRERNAMLGVGGAGIGSCSTVGPGGALGCQTIRFREEIDQYGGDPPRLRNGYRRGER